MDKKIADQLELLWRLGYDVNDFTLLIKSYNSITGGQSRRLVNIDNLETNWGSLKVKMCRDMKDDEFFIIHSNYVK